MKLEPIALSGRLVRLELLSRAHVEALARVGLDPEIWRWNPRPPLTSRADMVYYVDQALSQQASGCALAPWAQRSGVNTEAKYLMLRHPFETLGSIRVEFKTDALNRRSRAAIPRIGATAEGTLRPHMVTASGRLRDSVYFSIIASEWRAVRARLEHRLREAQDSIRPAPIGLG